MDRLPFFIVDVFAEAKYAGNQLAVFRGAGGLAQAEMQRLARETNFSETTFVSSETPRDGGYAVRIFTPNEEVPFAGHPTLGTAHILRTRIAVRPVDKIVLNLKVGQIPVTFDAAGPGGGLYWMRQNAPEFGREIPREALAAVRSLEPAEIDERFPIEEVSTGLPFIIVPLKTLASLKRARMAREYSSITSASRKTRPPAAAMAAWRATWWRTATGGSRVWSSGWSRGTRLGGRRYYF